MGSPKSTQAIQMCFWCERRLALRSPIKFVTLPLPAECVCFGCTRSCFLLNEVGAPWKLLESCSASWRSIYVFLCCCLHCHEDSVWRTSVLIDRSVVSAC